MQMAFGRAAASRSMMLQSQLWGTLQSLFQNISYAWKLWGDVNASCTSPWGTAMPLRYVCMLQHPHRHPPKVNMTFCSGAKGTGFSNPVPSSSSFSWSQNGQVTTVCAACIAAPFLPSLPHNSPAHHLQGCQLQTGVEGSSVFLLCLLNECGSQGLCDGAPVGFVGRRKVISAHDMPPGAPEVHVMPARSTNTGNVSTH